MTDAAIIQRLELLTNTVQTLTTMLGARLNRAQLCERLGIHRNTLAKRIMEPGFPLPGKDGKWLLSEVIEWERNR
jgi:predicted DNA-binding transcriptional regulator AlpA